MSVSFPTQGHSKSDRDCAAIFLWENIKKFGNTVKREACEKCLQAWYVLDDPKTPKLDKILIYAAIIYTVSRRDIIPFAKFGSLGLADDGVAIAFVIKRINKDRTILSKDLKRNSMYITTS